MRTDLRPIKNNKRNSRAISKATWYKKAIGKCMFPHCEEYPEDLHHICPLSQNGLDEYKNYFVCCKKHHYKTKLHSKYEEKQVELLTWKYMVELELFGFTSNDFPEKKFRREAEKEIGKSLETK